MTDENEAREEKDARKWVRERFADRVGEQNPTLKEIAKKHNLLARKVEDLQQQVRLQGDALEKLLLLLDDLIPQRTEAPKGGGKVKAG